MIFLENNPPLQSIIDRSGEPFGDWSIRNLRSFFLPKREPNYSLNSIIHTFMKRLHQPYSEVMLMDEETRDEIFKIELDIINKEKEPTKKT